VTLVVDTNVVISGIFFAGTPGRIVQASVAGTIDLVVSPGILVEYRRVAENLARQFSGVDVSRILDLLTIGSLICEAGPLPDQVCDDPDDDKFLACALASGARIIVTGDKALLRLDGFRRLSMVRPRQFVDANLG